MLCQAPGDQGLLIIEAPRSHPDTPHSVGLLWTRDQPDTHLKTHNKHKRRTFMPAAGFDPASGCHVLGPAVTGIGIKIKTII